MITATDPIGSNFSLPSCRYKQILPEAGFLRVRIFREGRSYVHRTDDTQMNEVVPKEHWIATKADSAWRESEPSIFACSPQKPALARIRLNVSRL